MLFECGLLMEFLRTTRILWAILVLSGSTSITFKVGDRYGVLMLILFVLGCIEASLSARPSSWSWRRVNLSASLELLSESTMTLFERVTVADVVTFISLTLLLPVLLSAAANCCSMVLLLVELFSNFNCRNLLLKLALILCT